MSMVVAYYMPHNDGVEFGILDQPGQDTGLSLVDLYEVDGVIATFGSREEADAWLASRSRCRPAHPVVCQAPGCGEDVELIEGQYLHVNAPEVPGHTPVLPPAAAPGQLEQ